MVRTADAVGIQVCVDWSIRQCMLAAGWAAGLMPDGCAMAVAKPAAICPLAAAVHHSQLLRPTFWAHAERNDLLHNRRMSAKQMRLRLSVHTARHARTTPRRRSLYWPSPATRTWKCTRLQATLFVHAFVTCHVFSCEGATGILNWAHGGWKMGGH